jgi:putative transposase
MGYLTVTLVASIHCREFQPLAQKFIWCRRSDFVLDALEQALYDHGPTALAALIHHSDRGSQHLSMSYTERLAPMPASPVGRQRL